MKNILNACRAAREKYFSKVITFSGMRTNNPLRDLGDILEKFIKIIIQEKTSYIIF